MSKAVSPDHDGSITLAVGGVGSDMERRMSPDEVVTLKERLRDEELLGGLVTRIAFDRVIDRGEELTAGELATAVSKLAVHWALATEKLRDLPGSDWIEGATPPEYYAEEIARLTGSREGENNG